MSDNADNSMILSIFSVHQRSLAAIRIFAIVDTSLAQRSPQSLSRCCAISSMATDMHAPCKSSLRRTATGNDVSKPVPGRPPVQENEDHSD